MYHGKVLLASNAPMLPRGLKWAVQYTDSVDMPTQNVGISTSIQDIARSCWPVRKEPTRTMHDAASALQACDVNIAWQSILRKIFPRGALTLLATLIK